MTESGLQVSFGVNYGDSEPEPDEARKAARECFRDGSHVAFIKLSFLAGIFW